MAKIYRKETPHLFDLVIDEIQSSLAANIEWLDTIFGRCERLVKTIEGKKYYSANWYDKKNDYILVAPDENLGNFVFFTLDEPTDLLEYSVGDNTYCKIGFSIILWCDLRTINVGRDTEDVKEQMLQTLNGLTHLRNGRFVINKIWQKAENVFESFDYDEIDNQFFMHPFAGFRFEGEFEIQTACIEVIPPTPPVEPQYIRGHFTDGRTSFTFNINRNEPITVEVDKNGWWKWDVDRTITSLYECCLDESITILDYIEIVGVDLSNITSYYFGFGRNLTENDGQRIIDMSRCKGSIKFNPLYFAYRAKCLWYMPNIDIWSNGLTLQTQSRIIAKGYIKANMNIGNLNNLLQNNILSIIQSAQANVTYTLHSTIYAKCASGGEWHTDIQAAIDAKAAQGYVVTLISA